MSNIIVPRRLRVPLHPARRVRNGLLPSHLTAHHIARECNFVTAHCRKVVFRRILGMTAPTAIPGAASAGFFYFRSGEASTTAGSLKLRCVAAGMPDTEFYFVLSDGVNADITASRRRIADTGASTFTADDIGFLEMEVDILPDTEYEGTLWVVFARQPLSIEMSEVHVSAVDPADDIAIDHGKFVAKGPIHDVDMQKLVQVSHDLWKHNGAPFAGHAFNDDVPRITDATWTNILDSSASTTVDADTPGWNPRTTYHAPSHTDDVEAVVAVCASNDAVAGGDVRIQDANGTLATLSGFGTGIEWKTTSITLKGGSSGDHKIDPQFRGDGSNEFTVFSVFIYPYVT